ncbi:MAG: tetratricopeptide repeat protein [Acidobacteria bacterium]|nr:tetratricopeptide repeat protein [Acidobacteriota bacterium]
MAAALALAALAVIGWRGGGHAVPAASEGQRVAVLPFLTASDNPELQALADGLMESITSRLSQYESRNAELLVVPASEVRKVGVQHAANARGALGVNYALEGRLSEQGERIRLILTLIDAENMVQTDTAVINGERARALDLEDEAVTRVATLLNLHALPDQVSSIAPVAPGAQEFYLQGAGYLQRSDELDSVRNAIQLFEKSISFDANYAMAYAGLSKAFLYMRDRTLEPSWVTKADEASLRAVELRPDLLETQTARGDALTAQGRFREAIQVFNTALESNPRSEEAYAGLGKAYEEMGARAADPEEKHKMQEQAEAALRKAVSLRSNDWVTYKRLALFYYSIGRFDDAAKQYEIVTELAPDNAHAFANLGVIKHLSGDDVAAERYLRKTLELDPNRPSALRSLAALMQDKGDYRGAVELYEQLIKHNDNDDGIWSNLGGAYDKLGREPEADEAYDKAIALVLEHIEIEGESPYFDSLLAHHYANLGDFTVSRGYARKAETSDSPGDQINIAIAYALEGDADSARRALARALALGYKRENVEHLDILERLLPPAS